MSELLINNQLFRKLHEVNDKVAANIARAIIRDLDERGVIEKPWVNLDKRFQDIEENFTVREIADFMDRHPYKARGHSDKNRFGGTWYGVGRKGYDILIDFLKNYYEEES